MAGGHYRKRHLSCLWATVLPGRTQTGLLLYDLLQESGKRTVQGVLPEKILGGEGGEGMKVLIACEESQTVCKAFRERGHEAYSCDIQEPSGGHPEWHIITKKTCLWEKGVHLLMPTKIVEPVKGRKMVLKDGTVRYSCWEMDCRGSKEERAKARSKTFPGIAAAMAEQWGGRGDE